MYRACTVGKVSIMRGIPPDVHLTVRGCTGLRDGARTAHHDRVSHGGHHVHVIPTTTNGALHRTSSCDVARLIIPCIHHLTCVQVVYYPLISTYTRLQWEYTCIIRAFYVHQWYIPSSHTCGITCECNLSAA